MWPLLSSVFSVFIHEITSFITVCVCSLHTHTHSHRVTLGSNGPHSCSGSVLIRSVWTLPANPNIEGCDLEGLYSIEMGVTAAGFKTSSGMTTNTSAPLFQLICWCFPESGASAHNTGRLTRSVFRLFTFLICFTFHITSWHRPPAAELRGCFNSVFQWI